MPVEADHNRSVSMVPLTITAVRVDADHRLHANFLELATLAPAPACPEKRLPSVA
jgi:hypothetical protein